MEPLPVGPVGQTITLPEGLSPTVALIISILIALVPIFSLFSGMLNQSIRLRTDKGEKIAPALLTFAAILNFFAVNMDKVKQLLAMSQGKPVPVTDPSTSSPPVEPPKA